MTARTRGTHRELVLGAALLGALVGPAEGQPDTLPTTPRYRLEDVTIIGHGTPLALRESASSVHVFERETIEGLPARTIADVLSFVPGVVFLERDGSGQLPMAVSRGFFGGGETGYVMLAIDGVPVNDVRTGTADWTRIPVDAIERIEVLRGGASSLYGDAAVGGVVNVVTRAERAPRFRARADAGAWGELRAHASGAALVGRGEIGVRASVSDLGGYRQRAESTDMAAGVMYRDRGSGPLRFRAGLSATHIDKQDPGPLPLDEAENDPRRSDPLYGADDRRRDTGELSAGLTRGFSRGRLDADAALRLVSETATRTLQLVPGFGDTQDLDEDGRTFWSRVQGDFSLGTTSVLAGVEVDRGSYDARYSAPGPAGEPLAEGEGDRTTAGLYAEVRQPLGARVDLFVGGRFDHLSLGAGGRESRRFSRLSPRVGANVALSTGEVAPGNVYVSWSRSFKAPTLEQLYGSRRIPTGVPGETITFANEDLRPQTARSIEVGILQRVPVASGHAELALTAYRMDVDDEIDFDVATFAYGNILESRHEGIEAALTLAPVRRLAVEHSLGLSRTVFRGGPSDGNQLKNVPRTTAATALRIAIADPLRVSLTHRFVGETHLDDANTLAISGHHRFGFAASWEPTRGIRIEASGDNLFDTRANSLGFTLFDPASGGAAPFAYPLGGRSLRVGLSWSS